MVTGLRMIVRTFRYIQLFRIRVTFTFFLITLFLPPCLAASTMWSGNKKVSVPFEYTVSLSDVHSPTLSADALQLAQQLHLESKLREVVAVRKMRQANVPVPADRLEQYRDFKDDVLEAIEQSRMEIDFTQSEMSREEAVYSEMLAVYIYDRDRKVAFANAWGYRTNGALWAVAEALDIPTYKQPKYSIPSGAIGIVAGLVPSAFSLYALRKEGGDKFDRKPHPNMLSKVFDYPVNDEIEYPDSVWTWINSAPPSDAKQQTRLTFIKHWWLKDENLRTLNGQESKPKLDLLTGTVQNDITIQLINDRLAMLRHMHALVLQMERPLLELMMAVRGYKSMD
jgi:hypothetical protein